MSTDSNGGIVPLQTKLLGRLQWWMFDRGWGWMPNRVSSLRYWLWYWTGGRREYL